MHLLSKAFGGSGSFEGTLTVVGFGISIASWSTGLHDLISSFLGAVHIIDQREFEVALNSPTPWRTLLWVLMTLYLVWFCVLFAIGISVVQRVKGWQAALIGILGFIMYQGFFLIFNR
jgi:hypothetical protein